MCRYVQTWATNLPLFTLIIIYMYVQKRPRREHGTPQALVIPPVETAACKIFFFLKKKNSLGCVR